MLEAFGRALARYLSRERHVHGTSVPTSIDRLAQILRPADVLLVESTSIIGTAIKYLTQSTWSHAALYIGNHVVVAQGTGDGGVLIEADPDKGVHAVGLAKYAGYHCRICRPVGLTARECEQVIASAVSRIGHRYDMRNIIDLARYLFPTPPVPQAWRRRMIAFGSGDPTRAICSGLIAQAFEVVRYPVLPDITTLSAARADCLDCVEEILHVRHHSLFVPRDFDVSPYFEVVKPTLEGDFNHRTLRWATTQ